MHEILINIQRKEIRIAFLKHGTLYHLEVVRHQERQLTGNIYRGRVKNILHNIQSAFIDIDEGENGFIHISDIIENTEKFKQLFDMEFENEQADGAKKPSKSSTVDIEEVMQPEQPVLVQVVKEPIGSKGARLTSNISIAGRYLVLLPNSSHRGVSRKIEDRGSRDKLKKLIKSFEMPQDMGLICRTASANASQETLVKEANELLKNWQNIVESFQESHQPTLLFTESDLIKKTILTAIDKRYDRVLIDDYATYQKCKQIYSPYSFEHSLRIEYYRDKAPIFERFNVEKEIEKSLRRKIWLPSGGYLFFDRTEAMYTIDVNSGRSSNNKGDVEESLVRINMEAVDEIARQLRIRNIGGLVICDFIDMRLRKNQRRVLDRLKDQMKEDSAKCTILGMSEFGLVEMTRQRHKGSLLQTVFTSCPYCNGSGLVKSHESVSIEIERAIKKVVNFCDQYAFKLVIHPDLDQYLNNSEKKYLNQLASDLKAKLKWETSEEIHINDFQFYSLVNQKRIEI